MKINKKRLIILTILSFVLISFSCVLIKLPFHNEVRIEDNKEKEYSGIDYYKIESSKEYSQEVKLKTNNVTGFEFYSKWRVLKDNFQILVTVSSKHEIYYQNVFTKIGNDFPNIILLKEPILNQKGEKVTITLKILTDGINIYLLKNDSGTIRFDQIVTKNSYWFLIFDYIALLFTFYFLSKELLNNRKHVLSRFQKTLLMILYFILCLIFSFLLLYFLYKCIVTNSPRLYLNCLLIGLLGINSFLALFIKNNFPKKMEYLFLIIAIPITSLYLISFTPGSGQDGIRHYARIISITNGNLLFDGAKTNIPLQIPYNKGFSLEELSKIIIEKANYDETYVDNQAGYSAILYIGPVFAIYIAKLLNLNPYIGWYLAKVSNLIIALILGFFIIRKVPKKYKLLMMLYILIPMNIYQFVCLSADTLINFSMLWLLTLCLCKYESKESLKLVDWIQIFITSYILIFGKDGYFLLPLACLILLKINIKNTKNVMYYIILIIFLLFGIKLGIQYLIKLPNITNDLTKTNYILVNVEKNGIPYVLGNIYKTIYMFGNYIFKNGSQYLLNFVGYSFWWDKKECSVLLPVLYLAILLLSCFNDENKNKLSDKRIVLSWLFIMMFTFSFIVVGMYALEFHSNIAIAEVWGVQGRYFITTYILGFIILSNSNFNININRSKIILASLIIHLLYICNFILFLI